MLSQVLTDEQYIQEKYGSQQTLINILRDIQLKAIRPACVRIARTATSTKDMTAYPVSGVFSAQAAIFSETGDSEDIPAATSSIRRKKNK